MQFPNGHIPVTAFSSEGLDRTRKVRPTIYLTALRHPVLMRFLKEHDVRDFGDIFADMAELGLRLNGGFLHPASTPKPPLPFGEQPEVMTAAIPVTVAAEKSSPEIAPSHDAGADASMRRMGLDKGILTSFIKRGEPNI